MFEAQGGGKIIDIYRFIDSCDIREYLQKLNHRFTTPEAAFLVYWCKTASLKEKFAAWREIIEAMSNCAMAERSAWEAEHQAQIEKMEQELAQLKQELSALYVQTRIVPTQYRDAYALQYIYDMISTSDYNVRQAIDSFDKNEQRRLDIMRLQEQQQANALAMEQNNLLDRQNSIAEKVRQDANIAAAVGAVQRHNTNKSIKKWLDK